METNDVKKKTYLAPDIMLSVFVPSTIIAASGDLDEYDINDVNY